MNETNCMQYLDVGYTRKSSEPDERQAQSLESQEKELLLLAKRLDIKFCKIIQEAKSAKVVGRKGFGELVEDIESGRANRIFTWHPDRLSRNPQDAAIIVSLMDAGKLLEVVTPSQTFRNNPMDKFMLGFFMLQAKFENDSKGVNVKRGLNTKAEKGWLPSGAKPGYMNDKYAEKGNKTILKDPTRFLLIRKAWDLLLTGLYPPPKILDTLNNEWGYRTPQHKRIGGKPMSRSMIYLMFSDPFYYGEFEYPVGSGNWHKGKHEAMISKEEFDRGQILLGRNRSPRPHTKEFSYVQIMSCGECNAAITAEEKWQVICATCKTKFASQNRSQCPKCNTLVSDMKNPTILHYIYYHCTKRKNPNCTQKSIQLDKFEEQVDQILEKATISDRFRSWGIKYLNEMNDREIIDRSTVLDSLQQAYKDCADRIDNLVKLKISPQNKDGSLLSDEEFKSQKDSLMKEKRDLQGKLNGVDQRITKWVELTEKAFNFACYSRHWLEYGDAMQKRSILQGISSNIVLQDKIVRTNDETPIQFIQKAKEKEPSISEMFEHEKKTDTAPQLEAYWSQNPSLLRDEDSNLEP